MIITLSQFYNNLQTSSNHQWVNVAQRFKIRGRCATEACLKSFGPIQATVKLWELSRWAWRLKPQGKHWGLSHSCTYLLYIYIYISFPFISKLDNPHVQSFSIWHHFPEGRLEPARLLLWSEARDGLWSAARVIHADRHSFPWLAIAGEGPNSWSPQPIPIQAPLAQDSWKILPSRVSPQRSPMAFMIEWAEENSDPNLVPISEPWDLLQSFYFSSLFWYVFPHWYYIDHISGNFWIFLSLFWQLHWQFLAGTGNWMRKLVVMPVTQSPLRTSELLGADDFSFFWTPQVQETSVEEAMNAATRVEATWRQLIWRIFGYVWILILLILSYITWYYLILLDITWYYLILLDTTLVQSVSYSTWFDMWFHVSHFCDKS